MPRASGCSTTERHFATGAFAVDDQGNVVVRGWSDSGAPGFVVVKFAGADDHVMWFKDLTFTGYSEAFEVVVDGEDSAYVAGHMTGRASVGRAILTVKLSAAGTQLEGYNSIIRGPAGSRYLSGEALRRPMRMG
jgi:hypothetical protein